MPKNVTGYSSIQIALHWAVVVLVAFQYVAHSGIEAAWNAMRAAELPLPDVGMLAYLHIGAGLAVLLLALTRIGLRLTRGAPPPPPDEPKLLQVFAEGVHVAIYVFLILLPLSGLAAWFLAIPAAGSVHVLLKNALLAAIFLHVSGALFQHFVRRSDVLMRMLRPEPDRPDQPLARAPAAMATDARTETVPHR
jgi:cytochrome b561